MQQDLPPLQESTAIIMDSTSKIQLNESKSATIMRYRVKRKKNNTQKVRSDPSLIRRVSFKLSMAYACQS